MIQKLVAEIEKTIDSSTLEISIFATESSEKLSIDKYRLHYMNDAGQMVFRYDNSPHHPEIDSCPHYKHTAAEIRSSNIPSIKDILNEISAMILRT